MIKPWKNISDFAKTVLHSKTNKKSYNMQMKTVCKDNMHGNGSMKSNVKIFAPWQWWQLP